MAKVIGIVGSPHENGNTEILMNKVLETIAKEGFETELIKLCNKKIIPCKGHGTEFCKKACPLKDNMVEIYKKVTEADGLIIGSPVYVGLATAQTVVVMGRLVHLQRKGIMRNKIGGAIAAGKVRNGGQEGVISDIVRWMQIMEMIIASSENSDTAHFGATSLGDASKDKGGLESAKMLGKRVVELINMKGNN